MTADGDGTDADRPSEEDYGGFVFDEGGGGSTSARSALPSLEQRLAPIVALLIVVSLVLTGGYILFTALSGPSKDVLGSTGGSSDLGAPNGSGGSTTAPTTTTDTVTATATSTAPATRNTGTIGAPITSDSATDTTTVANPTDDAVGTPITTTTARAVERTTADRTGAQPTTTTSDDETTTATPTETPTRAEATAATVTPESRSPSINSLSTERRTDEGARSTFLAVDWAVSDPDGDLETVEVAVVEEPEDGGRVVARRTIEVGGSDDSDETVFAIDEDTSDAYEIRLEAADETGNVALAVTRDASDE